MLSATVQQCCDVMNDNRRRFNAFCWSLSEEELDRPVPDSTWTVKDFIVHLAQFDEETLQWMEALKEGRTERPGKNADGSTFDVDAYNNARVAERHDWPLDRILEEAAATRERLKDAMETLEDAHIEQVVHFPGDNKRAAADVPFKLFLTGLVRHDPIHVADILKALPERANDPEMAVWMDDVAVRWYQKAMSGPPTRTPTET
jgi:hypothetical protein